MLEKFVLGTYVPFHTVKNLHKEYKAAQAECISAIQRLNQALLAHEHWFQTTKDENEGLLSESDDFKSHEKIAQNLRDWGMREREVFHTQMTLKEYEDQAILLHESIEALETYAGLKMAPSMPDAQIMEVMQRHLDSIIAHRAQYPTQVLFNEFMELQKCFWAAYMRKSEIHVQMNMSAMRQAQRELEVLGVSTDIFFNNEPLDPDLDSSTIEDDEDEEEDDDEEFFERFPGSIHKMVEEANPELDAQIDALEHPEEKHPAPTQIEEPADYNELRYIIDNSPFKGLVIEEGTLSPSVSIADELED